MARTSADDRRRQLVDAAIDVIAEAGLAKATTRRITARAGVPLAFMHYCFRSKDELLTAVADEVLVRTMPSFDRIPTDRGLATAINFVVDDLWRWVREERNLQLSLMELLTWVAHRERTSGVEVRVYQPTFELLAERLEQAAAGHGDTPPVSMDAVARLVVAGLDGLFMQALSTGRLDEMDGDVAILARAVVAMVESPRPAAVGRRTRGRPQSHR